MKQLVRQYQREQQTKETNYFHYLAVDSSSYHQKGFFRTKDHGDTTAVQHQSPHLPWPTCSHGNRNFELSNPTDQQALIMKIELLLIVKPPNTILKKSGEEFLQAGLLWGSPYHRLEHANLMKMN